MKYYVWLDYGGYEHAPIEEFDSSQQAIERIVNSGCSNFRVFTGEVEFTFKGKLESKTQE